MYAEMITVIGKVILEGMLMLKPIVQTRLNREYRGILQDIADAENQTFPNYTDAELDVKEEELKIFLLAFGDELQKQNMEKKNV